MSMNRAAHSLASELTMGPPPSLDAVADALLHAAVHDHAIDQDEATELLHWDLVTIAEYLALRLQEIGHLTGQEVGQILAAHSSGRCH